MLFAVDTVSSALVSTSCTYDLVQLVLAQVLGVQFSVVNL